MSGPTVHVRGTEIPATGIPNGRLTVFPYGDIGVLQDVGFYTTLGLFYSVEVYTASLANGATIDVIVEAPSSSLPPQPGEVYGLTLTSEATMDGDGLLQFSTGATYTQGTGTELTPDNRNDNSSGTSSAYVEQDPTVTSSGTVRDTHLITGGGGGNASGGNAVSGRRIIAPNETSLFRLTNQSGQARRALLRVTWVEAPVR